MAYEDLNIYECLQLVDLLRINLSQVSLKGDIPEITLYLKITNFERKQRGHNWAVTCTRQIVVADKFGRSVSVIIDSVIKNNNICLILIVQLLKLTD